jgi:hypothetical protein
MIVYVDFLNVFFILPGKLTEDTFSDPDCEVQILLNSISIAHPHVLDTVYVASMTSLSDNLKGTTVASYIMGCSQDTQIQLEWCH